MTDVVIAVLLHVLGVVWWIGGVTFVTLVIFPAIRSNPDTAMQQFRAIESRFAPQVRTAILIVGITGAWMLYRTGLWHALGSGAGWWLWAMIALWAVFFLMLFILGPTGVLRRIMSGGMDKNVSERFARMHRLHAILMTLAWLVIAFAVAGSRGLV